jgi:hypothetical protein
MYNNHLSDQYMKYQLEVPMYNNHLSDQYMKYQLEGTMYVLITQMVIVHRSL